jgi:hypothetical protein
MGLYTLQNNSNNNIGKHTIFTNVKKLYNDPNYPKIFCYGVKKNGFLSLELNPGNISPNIPIINYYDDGVNGRLVELVPIFSSQYLQDDYTAEVGLSSARFLFQTIFWSARKIN